MAPVITVEPLGRLAQWADKKMEPVMYWAAGTREEAPQMTHKWNNIKLSSEVLSTLDASMMVQVDGTPTAPPFVPVFFHVPRSRWGWRDYIVLELADAVREWHVGWRLGGEWMGKLKGGVTRIPLHGPVRCLLAQGDVEFFGIDAASGVQLQLREIGRGRIGEGGPYGRLPLL